MSGSTAVNHAGVGLSCRLAEEQHRPDGAIALLSIHPEYVELIKSGVKRVEFRRRAFARTITHVVIYATSPVKQLVGFCEVDRVVRGTPDALWTQHGADGGIPRATLFRYLDGLAAAIAIVLRPFCPLANRIALPALGVARPPQSFQYLTKSAFTALAKHTT